MQKQFRKHYKTDALSGWDGEKNRLFPAKINQLGAVPAAGVLEVNDRFDQLVGPIADHVASGQAKLGFNPFAFFRGRGGVNATAVDADSDDFAALMNVRHDFEQAFDFVQGWNLDAFHAGYGFPADFVAEQQSLGSAAVKKA